VKRFVANARAEVESEFNTAELRKLMSVQEEEMQKLRKLVEDTRHDVEQSQQLLTQSVDEAAQSVRTAAPNSETPTATPATEAAPVKLDKTANSATPAAEHAASASAIEAVLPAMTAQTIEDEMQALSQSLGETLHRPSFGAHSESVPHAAPSAATPEPVPASKTSA
jgi:sec-independent protein translocase protein TatB